MSFCFLLLVFFKLAVAEEIEFPFRYVSFTHGNGAQVVLVQVPGNHALVQTRWRVGWYDGPQGMPHAREHWDFLGTQTYPSKDLYEAARERLGMEGNASTFDTTNYFDVMPADNWKEALELHLESKHSPTLNEADIKREAAGPVHQEAAGRFKKNEIALFQEAMAKHVNSGFDQALFPLTGLPEQIKNYSMQEVWKFQNDYYVARNAMVLVMAPFEEGLEKAREIVEAKVSRLADHEPAKRASAKEILLRPPGSDPKFVKVYTSAKKARRFLIQFPINDVGRNRLAALYLSYYFNRRGKQSTFQPLFDKGLLQWPEKHSRPDPGFYAELEDIGADSRSKVPVLTLSFNLSGKGLAQIDQVITFVSSVMGSIAKNGLPDEVFAQTKGRVPVGLGGDLTDMGEVILNHVTRYGTDFVSKMGADILTVKRDLEQQDVKTLALELSPRRGNYTLITTKMKKDSVVSTAVMPIEVATKFQKLVPVWEKAYIEGAQSPGGRLNTAAEADAPFRLTEPQAGMALMVMPNTETNDSSFEFRLKFGQQYSIGERQAARVAFQAMFEEPAFEAFLHDYAEEGVLVRPSFNAKAMQLTINVSGSSRVAVRAFQKLMEGSAEFSGFRTFALDEAGFLKAKQNVIAYLKDVAGSDVAQQSLQLAFDSAFGGKPIDPKSQASQIRQLKLEQVQGVLSKIQTEWQVEGVLMGSLPAPVIDHVRELVLPPNPIAFAEATESAKTTAAQDPAQVSKVEVGLPQPSLVKRIAEIQHQSVTRTYFFEGVKPYSQQYYALRVFAEGVLQSQVERVLRWERSLAYSPFAGVRATSKGTVVFLSAESSLFTSEQRAAFDEVVRRVLVDPQYAPTADQLMRGLKRLYEGFSGEVSPMNYIFDGFDPNTFQASLQLFASKIQSDPALFMDYIAKLFVNSKSVDAAVAGKTDPLMCDATLMLGTRSKKRRQ